ncbi:hypothetical protein I4U23_004974 [Adineta vaga]|nr:hypothetical protein I4U23_004974 [Adineta vaga]
MTRNTGTLARSMASQFRSIYTSITIVLIILPLLSALPLASMIVGITRIKQCPIQPKIPMYMIVFGAVGFALCVVIISVILSRVFCCYKSRDTARCEGTTLWTCSGAIPLLLLFFAWFIVGCVWVFNVRGQVQFDNPDQPDYCHKSLYNFAYCLLIAQYNVIFLICCICYAFGQSNSKTSN